MNNIIFLTKLFSAFYFITLYLYHYFSRDIKKDMATLTAKNSVSVYERVCELRLKGDKKAKIAYIIYWICAFNLTVLFGLVMLIEFS